MSLRKETWAAVAVSALLHLGAAGVLLIGGSDKASAPPTLERESQAATRVRLVASKKGSGYFSDAPGPISSLTPFSPRRPVAPSQPSTSEATGTGSSGSTQPTARREVAAGEGAAGEVAAGEFAAGDDARGGEPASGQAPGGNAGTAAGSIEAPRQGEAGGEPGGTSAQHSELQRRLAVAARGCYPEQARRMRLKGTLLLKLCLDGSGAASSVAVLGGSGLAVLDRAATECVVARALPVAAVGPGCFQVPVVFGLAR